jgi:hypothetical protein
MAAETNENLVMKFKTALQYPSGFISVSASRHALQCENTRNLRASVGA